MLFNFSRIMARYNHFYNESYTAHKQGLCINIESFSLSFYSCRVVTGNYFSILDLFHKLKPACTNLISHI